MNAPAAASAEWLIPARLAEVDTVCAALLDMLTDCSEGDRFALHLLARESLNNAVLHGSRLNARLQVRCELWCGEKVARLRVSDEGPGFDWRAGLSQDSVPQERTQGRGLILYRLYADQIEFNPSGNSVTLVRNLNGRRLAQGLKHKPA